MKILMVHNHYGSSAPSGENQVFQAEMDLLRSHGHQLETFTRHSDEIRAQGLFGQIRGALALPWNPSTVRQIRRQLDRFRPDLVHVHNFFPLISPAVFHAIGDKAASVLTLHNYRLFCPAAIPMREGKVCTDCLERRSVMPALRHACYRNSRIATLPLAFGIELHRRLSTWTRQVDAFITLSDFQREQMTAAGLPRELTHVKANFTPGEIHPLPWSQRRDCVLFVGRLSEEKGVRTLIQAWDRWQQNAPELRIIGDGPLAGELAERSRHLPVRLLGQVSADQAKQEIAAAKLLVMPSQWFEGFPMVIAEALASGTPVSTSRIGPLPDIVGQTLADLSFEAGSAESLYRTLSSAWRNPEYLRDLSKAARERYLQHYSAQSSYQVLMEIYRQALEHNRQRLGS